MKLSNVVCVLSFLVAGLLPAAGLAQGNLDVDSPAITALKGAMQQRHSALAPLYASGAIGLASDGTVALRDASGVPLAQRSQVNGLISAENSDRVALYREIARANSHPEWEADVRKTFAERWIERAQAGWWVQRGGNWVKK